MLLGCWALRLLGSRGSWVLELLGSWALGLLFSLALGLLGGFWALGHLGGFWALGLLGSWAACWDVQKSLIFGSWGTNKKIFSQCDRLSLISFEFH